MTSIALDTPRRVSDVPWLESVPEDWQTVPFFSVAQEMKRSNAGMVEDNLLSLSYGRIVRKNIQGTDGLLPESFETYQIVEPGEVVFRFTDLQNDQRSLRSGLVQERGIITSAYVAVRLRGVLPEFFAYLMRGYDLSKAFYGMGGGLRQSLRYWDVKRVPVLVPPLDEQRAIVAYLDEQIANIDHLIAQAERLVALAQERRASLVMSVSTGQVDVQSRTNEGVA